MKSETNKANKNKRKSRKVLIIGTIVGVIVVIGCGLFLLSGSIELMRAKRECKTCYSYPSDNHFGLTDIYVGEDFISVVVNAAKVNKYSDEFPDNFGINKPGKHYIPEGYVYVDKKAVYPDTLSVFRCGPSYIVTSRFSSSSESIESATAWHYVNYYIGPFSEPTLKYGEYGGEWDHTYEQVYLPDQGVFGPLEDEEHVYYFGPGLNADIEEIDSEVADSEAENSSEEAGEDSETENSSEEIGEDSGAENSTEEADEQLTDEQAVELIKQYCYAQNPDLESIVEAGEYAVYWNVNSSTENEIVVMFRSYTGAQLFYYIDRNTGDTYETEFVPGITTEEERTGVEFNIRNTGV